LLANTALEESDIPIMDASFRKVLRFMGIFIFTYLAIINEIISA